MISKKKFLVISSIFICLCSFIFPSNSFAEIKKSYNFKHFGIDDGLSQSTVETLYQDKDGYIWIGTNDGLDRYNGYQFNHYKYDKYDKNTISNNYIVDIIQDKDGYMWIATLKGLNRIDVENNEIKQYYSGDSKGGLSDDNLWEILCTSDNKLLVSSINGLSLYQPDSDSFVRVLNDKSLPSQFIYSLAEDKKGNIWIGTDKGVVKCDKELNVIKDYSNDTKNSEVYRIYDDGNDSVWVSTLGNGLFRINQSNDKIVNYTIDSNLPSNTIRDTLKDKKGYLWICTDSGISAFNYKDESFTNYKNQPYNENCLSDNETYCLLEDDGGLVWVGTYDKISRFNPNSNFSYYASDTVNDYSISNKMVNGIYATENTLWVGTHGGGVNIIDNKTKKMHLLTIDNSNLVDNTISDITGAGSKVYVGTNGGLNVFDINSIVYYSPLTELYTVEDGLPSNKIRSLFIDNKGLVWIGTSKGLAVLNPETKKITNLNNILEKAGVPEAFVRVIYQDSDGDYYIGCFLEAGLIKIDAKTGEIKLYKNQENNDSSISNDSIRDIKEYSPGTILIATSHGLNILDKETDKFTHYTEKNGLANNTVYGILIDSNKYIWMSTNHGISKFNLEKEKFESFTVADGLQSDEFNGKSSFKTPNGVLLFGGVNGFNIFNPSLIESSSFMPKLSFDAFKVGGVNTQCIDGKKLKSTDNNIEISYFVNDYKNSEATKYYYKLEGLDGLDTSKQNWNMTTNNSILFSNLKPGNYTFKIQALNYNGVITNEEQVKFVIKPPIWKSTFAFVVYAIIILFAIYLNNSKVKRLDKLVDNKTKELQTQMKKNEKLFNKILALEKNKNNYFINLSHELRTPLNVLNSVNQLLLDLSYKNKAIDSNKIEYYMGVMKRNCDRLLNLINNIIDSAKLESNNYVITKKKQDIVYIVEETALSLKDYIESKDIELIIDTDVEEKYIMCDRMEIERCIINLVGNSIKFTPAGGQIEVLIYDLATKVKIVVKDTGIGISEENQKYIFDRFNQVIDAESETKGGSGLGLTIVKQLIELHGGTIEVKSELNKGSEFIITLPVV